MENLDERGKNISESHKIFSKRLKEAVQVHNMRNSLTGVFPSFYGRNAAELKLLSMSMLSAPNAARD
jgi:hypothetical protein